MTSLGWGMVKCWLASVFGKLGVSQGWKTLLEHSGNIKKVLDHKIYLGISLELLRAVWGQFSFR